MPVPSSIQGKYPPTLSLASTNSSTVCSVIQTRYYRAGRPTNRESAWTGHYTSTVSIQWRRASGNRSRGRPIAEQFRSSADYSLTRAGRRWRGSLGRKRYIVVVRKDHSRFAWVYFIRHKSDAAEAFEQFLADTRSEGIPSAVVVVVRLNDRGKFLGGTFGALCTTGGIKH